MFWPQILRVLPSECVISEIPSGILSGSRLCVIGGSESASEIGANLDDQSLVVNEEAATGLREQSQEQ